MKIRVEVEKTETEWIVVVSYAAEGSASMRYVFLKEKAFKEFMPYAYDIALEHITPPPQPEPDPAQDGDNDGEGV